MSSVVTGPTDKPMETEIRQCIAWACNIEEIAAADRQVQYLRGDLLLSDGYLETLTPVGSEGQDFVEILMLIAHAFAMDARERSLDYGTPGYGFGGPQDSLGQRIFLHLLCFVALGPDHHFDAHSEQDRNIAADMLEEMESPWADALRKTTQ